MLGACQDNRSALAALDEPTILALAADDKVVADVGQRHGLDLAGAQQKTQEIAALARAYLQRDPPQAAPHDLVRRHQRRATAVQLWLTEQFEAEHLPHHIERNIVTENLANSKIRDRYFHPKIHGICQILVEPTEGHSVDVENDHEWQMRAKAMVAAMVDRMLAGREELVAEKDCELFFDAALKNETTSADKTMRLRSERLAIQLDLPDRWVAPFVAAVSPYDEPDLVPPFFTKFGLHFVLISQIMPAHLPDGSMPPDALQAAREQELREHLHPAWRKSKFAQMLAGLRRDTPVRISQSLGLPSHDPP